MNTYQRRFMVVCLLMVLSTLDNYVFIKSMYSFSKDDGTQLYLCLSALINGAPSQGSAITFNFAKCTLRGGAQNIMVM